MAMEEYAILKIKVLAPADQINGDEELELSDALAEIEQELAAWLARRAVGTWFRFEVRETDEAE